MSNEDFNGTDFFFQNPSAKESVGNCIKAWGGKHNLLTDGFADECRDLGIK